MYPQSIWKNSTLFGHEQGGDLMQNSRHLSLSSNGQEQVLTIPPDLSLSSTEVLVRKEGDRLIVEPIPRDSLLSLLKTLPELTETWPDIDEGLLPLDDITL